MRTLELIAAHQEAARIVHEYTEDKAFAALAAANEALHAFIKNDPATFDEAAAGLAWIVKYTDEEENGDWQATGEYLRTLARSLLFRRGLI